MTLGVLGALPSFIGLVGLRLAATIETRWLCEQAHQQLKKELGRGCAAGRLRYEQRSHCYSRGAMGKAVICSRTKWQVDVIDDGETGIDVPGGNPAALREAMIALWDDPERARAMGAKASAYVELHHTLEMFCERVKHAIEASLSRSALTRRRSSMSPDRSRRLCRGRSRRPNSILVLNFDPSAPKVADPSLLCNAAGIAQDDLMGVQPG
jgi:hypothetical protein